MKIEPVYFNLLVTVSVIYNQGPFCSYHLGQGWATHGPHACFCRPVEKNKKNILNTHEPLWLRMMSFVFFLRPPSKLPIRDLGIGIFSEVVLNVNLHERHCLGLGKRYVENIV